MWFTSMYDITVLDDTLILFLVIHTFHYKATVACTDAMSGCDTSCAYLCIIVPLGETSSFDRLVRSLAVKTSVLARPLESQ